MTQTDSTQSYSSDRHLDIVVFGPMGSPEEVKVSSHFIQEAAEAILQEPAAVVLLRANGVTGSKVHIPERFQDAQIIPSVLSRLDFADLVIVNVAQKEHVGSGKNSPKKEQPQYGTSPNVMYELALVHTLGIPYILVGLKGQKLDFYIRGLRCATVPEFTREHLQNGLRPLLMDFLDVTNSVTNFVENPVSAFYDGLPIVDVSAAVGLATGYYYNFVRRLLLETGVRSKYPEKIRHVIIVRPPNVLGTYESDEAKLKETLVLAGIESLLENKLKAPENERLGPPPWFNHVNGIVFDIPRMIYPLQYSPRLKALRSRERDKPEHIRLQHLRSASERLLDRVERVIKYHCDNDGQLVRGQSLHFSHLSPARGNHPAAGGHVDIKLKAADEKPLTCAHEGAQACSVLQRNGPMALFSFRKCRLPACWRELCACQHAAYPCRNLHRQQKPW